MDCPCISGGDPWCFRLSRALRECCMALTATWDRNGQDQLPWTLRRNLRHRRFPSTTKADTGLTHTHPPNSALSSSLHGTSSHLFAVRSERLLCSLSSTHIFRYLLVRFCHSRGDTLCHFIRTRWGHHLFRTWIWVFRWTVLML